VFDSYEELYCFLCFKPLKGVKFLYESIIKMKLFSLYENNITAKCICQVFSQIAYLKTLKPVTYQLGVLNEQVRMQSLYQKKH